MAKVNLDPKKASAEQIAEGLALLAKKEERKERIKKGEIKGGGTPWADMTEEQKDQRRSYNRRRNAKQALILDKAAKAGITVSEAEVDAFLAGK